MLACGTSSTALLRHRSIIIQLRLAALYLMHYRLFQQTLFKHRSLNIKKYVGNHPESTWIYKLTFFDIGTPKSNRKVKHFNLLILKKLIVPRIFNACLGEFFVKINFIQIYRT